MAFLVTGLNKDIFKQIYNNQLNGNSLAILIFT